MYSNQSDTRLRSSLKNKVINLAFETGLIRAGRSLWAKSLTVVNYHRIDDPNRKDFDSFKPNVSATADDFNRQMDYLAKWFNVISLKDIVEWLNGHKDLPAYATLITFDDGYLDNYTSAYPILRQHNFPALIFLTTQHIGTDAPFYWDMAAYCFYHTQNDHLTFPNGRVEHWSSLEQLDHVSKNWIEFMKTLPQVTLLNGPSSLSEVKRNPLAIRRIFISHKHSLPLFATLLTPLNRII